MGNNKLPRRIVQPNNNRWTFLYLEKCVIGSTAYALTAQRESGVIHIAPGQGMVLLLGPGVSITSSAIKIMAHAGMVACWMSEGGLSWYAAGAPINTRAHLAEEQARAVSLSEERVLVAKRMYSKRYGVGEFDKYKDTGEMRLAEARRVKALYAEEAAKAGVTWVKRKYNIHDLDSADAPNRALCVANHVLYGVTTAVVHSLGCIPGLGIVHTKMHNAFVLDVADMYKHETTVPAAFELARAQPTASVMEMSKAIRPILRERFVNSKLMQRMSSDIVEVLTDSPPVDDFDDAAFLDAIVLWDQMQGEVSGGILYE